MGQADAELICPLLGGWEWWCGRRDIGSGGERSGGRVQVESTWSPVPSPAGLPCVQLQLSPQEIGVDSEKFAQSINSECSEWSSRCCCFWKGDGFLLLRKKQVTAVPGTLEGEGVQDRIGGGMRKASVFLSRAPVSFYRKGKQSVGEGLFLHTWAPSARSREVRLRRLLMALSTCSCRVSDGWEELANRACPRRMASESRARPCQTSMACCSI